MHHHCKRSLGEDTLLYMLFSIWKKPWNMILILFVIAQGYIIKEYYETKLEVYCLCNINVKYDLNLVCNIYQ